MNNKKNTVKYSELFLQYQSLFTKKQKSYLTDYFLNDLSFKEVAIKYYVTTMAVVDSVNRSKKTLNFYESKLHLHEKFQKRIKIYAKMSNKNIKNKLEEIDKI
ncbi:MAG: hypothetical protein LBL38_01585 [Lactobacillales bacterium]|jgi:predicted DNA-binding protein YlxM (UPF0122 family)|nr:hypothetical protein [Lactobacillales bacterium]